MKQIPKSNRPETVSQSRTWDGNYARYKTAGWCRPCASQAAWGHQIGFSKVDPVRDCCRGKEPAVASTFATRWANREPAEAES